MTAEPGNRFSEDAPRNTRGKTLLRWGGTLVALGLLVYLLAEQNWSEFFQTLQHISVVTLIGVVATIFLSRLAIGGRWYTLLRSAGVKISVSQALRLLFAGLFANNFLIGTVGGDVVRLAGAIRLNLDGTKTAASLIADRVVGAIGMAFMLPFGLPFVLSAPLPPVTTGLSALPVTARLKPVVQKLARLVQKLVGTFALWARQPVALATALGWTFGHMVLLFGTFWLLLQGMGEPISPFLIAGLYSLVYFITLLPISINGLGVQEVAITYFFSHFGGVSLPACLALAIITRMLFLLASLPGALFVPGLIGPDAHKS